MTLTRRAPSSRRPGRGQRRLRAPLPRRRAGPPADSHRLRRRAPLQGRDHAAAGRAGAARTWPATRPMPAALAARSGSWPPEAPLASSLRPRPGQAAARAGRGLPHRLRGRVRRAPRRGRGRDRRGRRPGGGARPGRGAASAVHRDPHQVVRRRVASARRAHAGDLPRDAAGRDGWPPARQLRGHAAQGHHRRAAARAGASVRRLEARHGLPPAACAWS